MVNYHDTLVAALKTVLPTYYETKLKRQKTPCISYQEMNNYAEETGDTLGYSRLSYRVKIWGNEIEELQRYALEIDAVLRPLGWKRTSSGELHDNESTMIQKIMTYEAKASETF